jgi:hypothetical protein
MQLYAVHHINREQALKYILKPSYTITRIIVFQLIFENNTLEFSVTQKVSSNSLNSYFILHLLQSIP